MGAQAYCMHASPTVNIEGNGVSAVAPDELESEPSRQDACAPRRKFRLTSQKALPKVTAMIRNDQKCSDFSDAFHKKV